MERREILIANNRDQSRYRVVTDATTLGELQDAIARNEEVYKLVGQSWVSAPSPIDISGLTFTEGITSTQMLSRYSVLPTNVRFKGQTTNNLVMLLTNPNKQIRSGADYPTDRKLFSAYIKQNSLGETITAELGNNWTRIPTDKLIAFFASHEDSTASNKDAINEVREELKDLGKESEVVNTSKKKLPDVKAASHAATVEWFYEGIKKMAGDNLLYAEDVVVLADLATELAARLMKAKPEITSSDIDSMMESICQ